MDLYRNQFCRKKLALQLKKEDHCKLKKKERALDWFRIFNLVKERKAKTEIRFGRNIFGQSMFEPYTLFPVLMSTTFSLEFFFSTGQGLTNVLKMSIKAMQRFGKHKVMYYTMCTQRKL